MTSNELFLKHAAVYLRQYLGNLRWFCEAVDKGSIPSGDNEAIRPHVHELKKFMKMDAETEDEEILFRFGLIVPGLIRGIEPPLSVLEPERGDFSDKRMRQAAGQVTRLLELLRFGRQY